MHSNVQNLLSNSAPKWFFNSWMYSASVIFVRLCSGLSIEKYLLFIMNDSVCHNNVDLCDIFRVRQRTSYADVSCQTRQIASKGIKNGGLSCHSLTPTLGFEFSFLLLFHVNCLLPCAPVKRFCILCRLHVASIQRRKVSDGFTCVCGATSPWTKWI